MPYGCIKRAIVGSSKAWRSLLVVSTYGELSVVPGQFCESIITKNKGKYRKKEKKDWKLHFQITPKSHWGRQLIGSWDLIINVFRVTSLKPGLLL